MVCGARLLIGLAAALGITELSCHASGSHGVGHLIHHAAKKFAHFLHHSESRHHGEDSHKKKCEMIDKAKVCHMGCGMDHECHQKCPNPLKRFQEKCEMLKPLKACHERCRHDFACHKACTLPEDPKMAHKVKDSLKCHAACKPGDRECHHACGHPFVELSQNCNSMEQMMTCHKSCGEDSRCHHQCPKMNDVWHCDKHDDDDHEDRHEKKCEIMEKATACHMGCGMDDACHQKCPNPLKRFQEKCDMLKPLKACHEKCRHGFACHKACALPEDPKMARMVKDKMKCHGACKLGDPSGRDRVCHHACGRPFVKLSQKCDLMGQAMTCHDKCHHKRSGKVDFMCHHKCPSVEDSVCDKDDDAEHEDHHRYVHHEHERDGEQEIVVV